MTTKIIYLMGPQGSGKGTQGERLSGVLGLPLVTMGNILGEEMKKDTDRGRLIRDLYTKGELTPHSITKDLLKEVVVCDTYRNGLLLDGYPRKMEQALDAEKFVMPNAIVVFELSDDEAIARLSQRRVCAVCKKIYHITFNPPPFHGKCVCGGELIQRPDDTPEALKRRLQIYRNDTEPVIVYFENKGVLVLHVDAAPAIDEVFTTLMAQLKQHDII